MNELKPCPFCGGEASLSMGQMGVTRAQAYYIECDNCAASSEMFFDGNRAIKAWNNRVKCGEC